MRHNREAFERWRVVPRMLHGGTQRDLATSVVGIRLSSPLLLAPIGAASLVAANSDMIIARGAASAGTPYVISSQGCNPMEDTAAAMGSTPFWYQLYWSTDERLVDSMIGRAESCGARALVVTLDTTILGWRPRDLDLGSLPFLYGKGIAQYTSDPVFRAALAEVMEGRTTLIIAHRPATIALADRVVLLHDGFADADDGVDDGPAPAFDRWTMRIRQAPTCSRSALKLWPCASASASAPLTRMPPMEIS